jgi:RNA polymerase sigma-70 factor (ECF subfamily)
LAPDRAVLVRKVYLLGLSYEEVCAEIGVPLNTVKSWLRRSLLALKSCMTGEA